MSSNSNSELQATWEWEEWDKIFATQVTENYLNSVLFMKQITVVAVSTIVCLRNASSMDSFTVQSFGGLRLKILKKKCRHEVAQFLTKALTQAFEAVDKKYLHQLAICIYDGECEAENLFEYYIFKYLYKRDKMTMNVRSSNGESTYTAHQSFDKVREQTINLLRACIIFTQSCSEGLPSTCQFSVRAYYNEDAPKGYQAPGFVTSDGEDHIRSTPSIQTMKLGCVDTPFHSISARTCKNNVEAYSYEALPTQNQLSISPSQEHDSAEVRLRCPCMNSHNDADVNRDTLLTCQYCNTQQHAVCFGVLPEDVQHVKKHCCANCYDENPSRTSTDAKMANVIHMIKRQSLAAFRRTLYYCLHLSEISVQTIIELIGMPKKKASIIFERLKYLKIIEDVNPGSMLPSKINVEKLKEIINVFFNRIEKEVIVGRLLEEIMTDQDPQHDPIGEVLDPLEKVNLQDAVNVGRFIENPAKVNKTTDIEDVTMKQYREVILSNDSVNNDNEELPLSGSHNPVKDFDQIGKKKSIKRKVDDDEKEKIMMSFGIKTKNAKLQKNN